MNKQQAREVENLKLYHAHGMTDTVARSLSALIRCAMTRKSREALLAVALELGVVNHPEFII